jgi:hypothetical protein
MPEPPISGSIVGDPQSCALSVTVEVRMFGAAPEVAPAPHLADA